MDDRQIIELYNERSEAAISETADKYGKHCHYIAYNILYNNQDSEECVNDNREKRGKGQTNLVLEELSECTSAGNSTEQEIDARLLVESLNIFLRSLPSQKRRIMVRRYWYLSPVNEIARDFEMSEGSVKTILHRTRIKLKHFLEKEGIVI